MSERLHQLRRQQALIREHLAWLDAEVARERGSEVVGTPDSCAGTSELAGPPALPTPIPARHLPHESQPALALEIGAAANRIPLTPLSAEAQALLDQYSADESNKREDARRGCFIIFAIALAVLILGVAAVWWFGYRKPA